MTKFKGLMLSRKTLPDSSDNHNQEYEEETPRDNHHPSNNQETWRSGSSYATTPRYSGAEGKCVGSILFS